MSDDQENCFNRIKRKPSLDVVYNTILLYNINYAYLYIQKK